MKFECIARLTVCIAAAFLPEVAQARDFYFFNKPGVDRISYLNDRLVCDELAGGVAKKSNAPSAANTQIWQNRSLSAGQAAAAAGIASLLISFTAASERRHLSWQIERICLADKGYRRIEMSRADFVALDKIKDEALRVDQWFALASSASPAGKVMPE